MVSWVTAIPRFERSSSTSRWTWFVPWPKSQFSLNPIRETRKMAKLLFTSRGSLLAMDRLRHQDRNVSMVPRRPLPSRCTQALEGSIEPRRGPREDPGGPGGLAGRARCPGLREGFEVRTWRRARDLMTNAAEPGGDSRLSSAPAASAPRRSSRRRWRRCARPPFAGLVPPSRPPPRTGNRLVAKPDSEDDTFYPASELWSAP